MWKKQQLPNQVAQKLPSKLTLQSKWAEKNVVLFSTHPPRNSGSFHLALVFLSRSWNLHLMSHRWAEARAGVLHFHSHSVDQSSVICSPNYKAGSEMQPIVSPGRRGKNMYVAGAAEDESATQDSLNPLLSFLSTLNQTNTTHRKAHFHWLSGSDWWPCCIIDLAFVPVSNGVSASQSTYFCFISFPVLGNPAMLLYLDQAPGSPQRAVQGLTPEECIRHKHSCSITYSPWLEHDVISLCRMPHSSILLVSFSHLPESDLVTPFHQVIKCTPCEEWHTRSI